MARERTVRQAVRRGQYARVLIAGAEGEGKTFTALHLAMALEKDGRTTVIDTEPAGPGDSWSSDLHVGKIGDGSWTWDTWGWPAPYDTTELAEAILSESKIRDVIVVDSHSHFWQGVGGVLDHRDQASRLRFGGNDWAAWSEVRPVVNEITWAVQNAHCHVILCARAATKGKPGQQHPETTIKQDPELGHEVTFAFLMDPDRTHKLIVRKSRAHDLISVGNVYKPGDQQAQLFADIAAWTESAEPVSGPVSDEQVREIMGLFDRCDSRDRGRVKKAFKDKFGLPNRLGADTFDDALDWVKTAVAPSQAAEPQPATEEPSKTRKKAAKKPAAKKAAKKRGKAKPKTAQEQRSEEIPAEGEPWDDPAPETHSEPAAAPEGNTAADDARAQMTDVFLQMPGPYALQIENSLRDAGLWPIGEIADDQVNQAANVMAPIAEAAAEGEATE